MVLDVVADRGSMDYRRLASITGMPEEYAAERLTRYARRGLLTRDRDGDGGLSTFELSPKGRERLRFFRRC